MNDQPLILVIDDDPDICSMIKIMLEYHNYKVLVSDNEQKADALLLDNPVDLILMDMLLSGADGTDVCRRMKQDEKTSSIPILMFSAHPNAQKSCLEAGAEDFISKPFEMKELLAKISFYLQPAAESSQDLTPA